MRSPRLLVLVSDCDSGQSSCRLFRRFAESVAWKFRNCSGELSVPMHRPSVLDPGFIPELLGHTIDASVEKSGYQRRLPDERV